MAFSKYNRGRPFLLVTRRTVPSEGQRTNMAKFGELGKWKVDEQVIIVDRVTDKHMTEATVIIDVLQQKLVKSRLEFESEKALIKHYLSTYSSYITEGISIWSESVNKDKKKAEALVNDLKDELDKIDVKVEADE